MPAIRFEPSWSAALVAVTLAGSSGSEKSMVIGVSRATCVAPAAGDTPTTAGPTTATVSVVDSISPAADSRRTADALSRDSGSIARIVTSGPTSAGTTYSPVAVAASAIVSESVVTTAEGTGAPPARTTVPRK